MSRFKSRPITALSLVCLIALLAASAACAPAQPTPAPAPTKPAAPPAAVPSPVAPPAPKPAPTTAPAASAPAGWPALVRVGTSAPSTNIYPVTVAITKLIAKYANVKADPAVYSTMAVFPEKLNNSEVEMGVINTIDSYNSVRGLNAWKGTPYSGSRFIMALVGQGALTLATSDSGIKKMADIKGKRYMSDKPGSATSQLLWGAIRSAYGLTKENTTIISFDAATEIVAAMKEGRTDAGIFYIDKATPFVMEISLAKNINYISLEEDKINEIGAKIPVAPYAVPAGSYKGQDQPWKGVGVIQTLVGRANLPDDLVYAIVASVYDHFPEYLGYAPAGNDSKLPEALNPLNFTIPVHAGAVKYYKEKGWWTKPQEDRQAALLKELNLQK